MADLAEAEVEQWAEAKGFVQDALNKAWSKNSERIAEAAFKAGLNAGALWMAQYLESKGLIRK